MITRRISPTKFVKLYPETCVSGQAFLEQWQFRTMGEAWGGCNRGDWMAWVIGRVNSGDKGFIGNDTPYVGKEEIYYCLYKAMGVVKSPRHLPYFKSDPPIYSLFGFDKLNAEYADQLREVFNFVRLKKK